MFPLEHTLVIPIKVIWPDGKMRLFSKKIRFPLWLQNRCVKIFTGHQHNFEKNLLRCNWSPDGQKVTSGSADRMVYIWDTTSRRILYKVCLTWVTWRIWRSLVLPLSTEYFSSTLLSCAHADNHWLCSLIHQHFVSFCLCVGMETRSLRGS
jgi:WD40 repeat protein